MKKSMFLALVLASSTSVAAPGVLKYPDNVVPDITLTFRIGSDGLTPTSIIGAQLVMPDGRALPPEQLVTRGNFRSASTFVVPLLLPPRTTLGQLSEMSLRLSVDGAARTQGDPYDTLIINSLSISTAVCSRDVNLAYLPGRPWKRMTGSERTADIALDVPADMSTKSISALSILVATGGDDLRGGAQATVTVKLNDGAQYPPIPLNRGANWANGSRNTVNLPLPRSTKLSDISGLEVNFDGAGLSFGQDHDNWNIDSVSVFVPRSCDTIPLADLKGSPVASPSYWWRATGQDGTKQIRLQVPGVK